MTEHDQLRDLTAGYVLGVLDAEDRAALERHLETCDTCRRDVVEFARLPSLLARVAPDAVPDDVTSADAVVDAVRADHRRLASSRRWWRRTAAVAAALVVVGTGVAALVAGDDEAESGRWDDGVALAVDAASDGTTARIIADEQRWGTYVYVSAEGLPPAEVYELWVVGRDGAWHPAGTWAPTPDGSADLGGSTRFGLDEIDRVVVTADGRSRRILSAS